MYVNGIISRFKEIADKYCGVTAAEYYNKKITYGELDKLSDKIAGYIADSSLGKGKVIGLYMEKNINSVAAMIGIMKAGYAYMPVSKSFPAERIKPMLEISDACAVISDDDNVSESLFIGKKLISFDATAEFSGKIKETTDYSEHTYVLFTSGSTGDPKGIMIKNESVVNIAQCMKDTLNNSYSRIGCTAPIFFDMSVAQIYYSLLNGKTLVLVPDEIKNIPDKFIEYLNEHNVESVDMTPTHMTMVMKYADSVGGNVDFPGELVSGGEPLPCEVADMLFRKLLTKENSKVFNFYGPTETCVYATVYAVDRALAGSMEYMKIGKPLRNYDVIIRDKNNKECRDGEVGEICITGIGLSSGYCGNSQLTDRFFTEFVRDCGEKMYCTGDLGYKDSEGELVCLGRCDDQVKIRGYRIELGEIENALFRCMDVRQAKVIKYTKCGIDQLVGFYVCDDDIDEKDIAAKLSEFLPDYMIPSRLIRTDKIELTLNGKADKKKLVGLLEEEKKNADYSAYELDEFVMDICTELLEYKANELSADDDFFLSGGDSARLMELYSRIYDTFGVSVSIAALYDKSSFSEIADEIKRCLNEKNGEKAEYSEKSSVTWLHRTIICNEKLETKKKYDKYGMYFPSYNIMHIIEMKSCVDVNRFRASVMKVIERHGAFRSIFVKEDNKYMLTRSDVNLTADNVFDYVSDETDFSDAGLRKYAKNFDIGTAPLVQVIFFENNGVQKVLFNVHHGIFDYFSMQLFVKELVNVYNNREIPHEETDYVSLLNEQNKRDKAGYAAFWRDYISGRTKKAEFAFSYEKPRNLKSKNFTIYNRTLEGEVLYALRELSRGIGATEYSMLISLFSLVLHKYSEKDDIFLGTYLPGRESMNSKTIGLFTKLVPIRFFINDEVSIDRFVENTNDNIRKILFNHYIDLDEIYVAANFDDYVQGELFSVIFNYVNDISEKEGELAFTSHECGDEPEKMPFSIKIFSGEERIRISIVACDENYSQESILAIMDDYIRLINVTAFSSSDTEIKLLEQEISNCYEKSNNQV